MPTADVSVRLVSEDTRCFRLAVRIREGADESSHEVTLSRALLQRLAAGESAEAFARRCFAFLLDREPKESILRSFDISIIARYFPEFESTIGGAM